MTEDKFTKGEWLTRGEVVKAKKEEGYEVIVTCPMYKGVLSDDEAKANSKLISAAPDMFNALNDALQMMEQTLNYRELNNLTGGNIFLECSIDKAKAAIKKATS